jgi:hypothetical protein
MQGHSSFFQSIIEPLRYKDVDSVIVVIHAGVEVDNFLQDEIIYSLGSLGGSPRGRISYLPDLDKKYIARQWISKYGHGRALLC